MAGHIHNALAGFWRPRRFGFHYPLIYYLRMPCASNYAELHTFPAFQVAAYKARFFPFIPRAIYSIANLIAESCHVLYFRYILFQCQFVIRQRTSAGFPSFAIDKQGRVYFTKLAAYFVHGFNIVDSHQVEPKAVYVVLTNPVFYRFNYKFAHHGSLGGRFITTCRGIRRLAVIVGPVIISRGRE